jgi:hypothetical protein
MLTTYHLRLEIAVSSCFPDDLHKDKCELLDRIDCLGHVIDKKGLHADADKMAKICDCHTPHNYHKVQ